MFQSKPIIIHIYVRNNGILENNVLFLFFGINCLLRNIIESYLQATTTYTFKNIKLNTINFT